MVDIKGTIYNTKFNPKCAICGTDNDIIINMFDRPWGIDKYLCSICSKIVHAVYRQYKEGQY